MELLVVKILSALVLPPGGNFSACAVKVQRLSSVPSGSTRMAMIGGTACGLFGPFDGESCGFG